MEISNSGIQVKLGLEVHHRGTTFAELSGAAVGLFECLIDGVRARAR